MDYKQFAHLSMRSISLKRVAGDIGDCQQISEFSQVSNQTRVGTILPTAILPTCEQTVGKMTVFFVVLRIPSEGC